jgi:hypothetical protein
VPTGPGFKLKGGGQVVELPDLAPQGSEKFGGRRALMGKEIGTQLVVLLAIRLGTETFCVLW